MLAKYREVSFHYDTNYIAVFIENSIMIVSSNTILSLYLQCYMKYYLNPAIVFDEMMLRYNTWVTNKEQEKVLLWYN